jgi:DNA-binding FadR family transcriptional regulator
LKGRVKRSGEKAEGRASDVIAQELRRLILDGEVVRNGFLDPTAELVGRFGVSRPTLREAFRILESEGLISVRQGSRRGVEVLAPSTGGVTRVAGQTLQATGATIGDLYEAMLGFEPLAARLLAERRGRREIAALREHEARLRSTLDSGSPSDHGLELARFHHLIVELTGNKVMMLVADMIADALEKHQASDEELRYDLAAKEDDRTVFRNRGMRSISKLIRLIEQGDENAAEEHWRRHVQNANEFWLLGQDRHAKINVLR